MNTLKITPRIRVATVAAALAAFTIGGASAASAHVHVIPDSTVAGGYAKITFRVPTESAKASTTSVSIALPEKTPLTYVATQPVAGWNVSVEEGELTTPVTVAGTTITKAPVKVTWKATGDDAAIAPGEFQEFSISAGPLPAAATELGFPATQTYSDGTVVQWNQVQAAGADEPENPLPAFTVTAAGVEGGHSDPAAMNAVAGNVIAGNVTDVAGSGNTAAASDSGDSSGLAIGLGMAGLIAGLIGLAAGGVALRRSGRSSVTSSDTAGSDTSADPTRVGATSGS